MNVTSEPAASSEGMVTMAPVDEAGEYAAYIYWLAETIFVSVFPVILLVGLTGNALSLAVMQTRELRKSPVSVFMSALAVADSLVLLLDFLNNWLKMVPNVFLLNASLGFCKFHRWFFDVVYTYAAWLVMSLAIERFIVVWFPLKAKSICTKKAALVGVIFMPIFISFTYLHSLFAWHIDEDQTCNLVPRFVWFMSSVHPWLTAVLYSYFPVIVLIVCTAGITVQLVKMKRQQQEIANKKDGDSSERAKEYKVAITVVSVCVTFFFLTVPLTLYYVLAFNLGQFVYQGPEMALIETFILIIGLSNHAINFFLYVITSEKFRRELVRLLPCCPGGKAASGSKKGEASSGTMDSGRGTSFSHVKTIA
jgi:hypothetical protein